MTLAESITLAEQAAGLKGLELLFDYTKFHIGVYLTLASSFIAVASVKHSERFALPLYLPLVWLAIVFFMIAGFAGGVIVSSITQCFGSPASSCKNVESFLDLPLGPYNWTADWLRGRCWTWIEHTAFWAGLLSALASFALPQLKVVLQRRNRIPPPSARDDDDQDG